MESEVVKCERVWCELFGMIMSDRIMMLVSDEETEKECDECPFNRFGTDAYLSFSFACSKLGNARLRIELLANIERRSSWYVVRKVVRPSGGHGFDGLGSERFPNPYFRASDHHIWARRRVFLDYPYP